MTGQCKSCGNKDDLREGHCWDCAEAESIIHEGTDMRDVGIAVDGKSRPANTAMEKLQYLIKKGRHK